MAPRLNESQRHLIHRYLIWCYKTTKEDLDRIDRYFTQVLVDRKILDFLKKQKEVCGAGKNPDCARKVDEFRDYMDNKEKAVFPKKFADASGKTLQPEYWYLKNRLAAIEQAVREFLGKKQLKTIRSLYEAEMTQRILAAREHS